MRVVRAAAVDSRFLSPALDDDTSIQDVAGFDLEHFPRCVDIFMLQKNLRDTTAAYCTSKICCAPGRFYRLVTSLTDPSFYLTACHSSVAPLHNVWELFLHDLPIRPVSGDEMLVASESVLHHFTPLIIIVSGARFIRSSEHPEMRR